MWSFIESVVMVSNSGLIVVEMRETIVVALTQSFPQILPRNISLGRLHTSQVTFPRCDVYNNAMVTSAFLPF